MKSSMRSRLEHLSRRLVDLDAILSEPDAANDMNQYRKLSRERAELEPVVKAFEAFEAAETDCQPDEVLAHAGAVLAPAYARRAHR